MDYNEIKSVKTASQNLTAEEKTYRIDYVVTDIQSNGTTESISATAYEVTTTGEGEAAVTTSTRVGSGYLNVSGNRNYFAIEKHSSVSMDAQAAVAAQFFADCKSVLADDTTATTPTTPEAEV